MDPTTKNVMILVVTLTGWGCRSNVDGNGGKTMIFNHIQKMIKGVSKLCIIPTDNSYQVGFSSSN